MTFGNHWIYRAAFWLSGMIFTFPMEKRENFKRNFWIFLMTAVVYEVFLWFLPLEGILAREAISRVFGSLILWAGLYGCWEVSRSVAFYNMIWGVSVWVVTAEGVSVLIRYVAWIMKSALFRKLGIVLAYSLAYLLCYGTIARWMPRGRKERLGPRQVTLTAILFLVINLLSFRQWVRPSEILPYEWGYFYLIQMLCILVLYLEGELFKKSQMRREMEMLNFLYKTQKEHYLLTKENMDLANQKWHDLKHQIRILRRADPEELDRYLGEIEESVKTYEAIVKTGNDVFDTILTEKSLYCREHRIQVSCVADTDQMDFIDTIDLYAILGNVMDNAIEAVEKLEEAEKRQIDVLIYRQQNFLVMNIINPMVEQLTYQEGLPVTTKKDQRFHGFGLLSVRHILKKYDGFLNVSEEDGCFSLKMLIPIPEKVTT